MNNNLLAYILHLLLIFGMYAVASVVIYHYEHHTFDLRSALMEPFTEL